eukprot:scaffold137302_cov21-Tisochrysis_lutea.AAC.2
MTSISRPWNPSTDLTCAEITSFSVLCALAQGIRNTKKGGNRRKAQRQESNISASGQCIFGLCSIQGIMCTPLEPWKLEV